MRKFLFVFVGLFLFLLLDAKAQEQDRVPYYVPPSPTAYELGKYGQIPVGMFTGTPNVSIPLYEYKTKYLTIPISLSYNSNGIKVDQVESNVGLGWSLNAGGVISKIVRGKSDEEDLAFFPEKELTKSNYTCPMAMQYFYDLGQGVVDSETDLYMFNFMGKSGKFVYDHNKKIVLLPYQDIKIEPYCETSNSGIELSGYRVTTSDGVKYYFLEKEVTSSQSLGSSHSLPDYHVTAWYLTRIEHPLGDRIDFTYASSNYTYKSSQSERLSVLFPSPQFACTMVAELPKYSTITNLQAISEKKIKEITSNNPYYGKVTIETSNLHSSDVGMGLISGVKVLNSNLNEVENISFDYTKTVNNRVFLDGVSFKDANKNYQFEYIDPAGLPKRLSYSQDHWGYYNGKTNYHLVPKITNHTAFMELAGANKDPDGNYAMKGLLSKITYPTKGYSQFTYESNSYYGDKVIPAHSTEKYLVLRVGEDEIGASNDKVETINVAFTQTLSMRVNVSFNSIDCSSDLDVGKSKVTLSIKNTQTNEIMSIYCKKYDGNYVLFGNVFTESNNGDLFYVPNIPAGSYEIRLHPSFECISASSTVTYYDQAESRIKVEVETGGVRIKRIVNHDPAQNNDNITRYYYGPMDKYTQPDGDEGQKAYYISNRVEKRTCSDGRHQEDLYFVELSSSSLTNLFNTGSNNIYYHYVTVSHGGDNFEKGGEEHEYTIHRDYPGNPIRGEEIRWAPWTNFGWDNGNEVHSKIFKKNAGGELVKLQETTSHYLLDSRNADTVTAYSTRKNYELLLSGPVTYVCTKEDTCRRYEYTYCDADHHHAWFLVPFGDAICIAPGHHMTTGYRYDACWEKRVGDTITFPSNLANIDITEYKNIAYWSYMDSSTTKQYDENGGNPLVSTTHYYYDNAKHLQQTRVETKNSKGEVIQIKTYYPDDDLSAMGLPADQASLVRKLGCDNLYQSATPVKVEKYTNGNKSNTQLTVFKNWGTEEFPVILPEIIETAVGSNPLEPKIRFYAYDQSNGNALEVSKDKDSHVAYVWGYEGAYPVVKADNTTQETLVLAIVNTINALNISGVTSLDDLLDIITGPADVRWASFNSALRAQASMKGVVVSSYTYKPLVGMTSSTDPNGVTTYFEYDSFGRLYLVKDQAGKVLKRYDYHYGDN